MVLETTLVHLFLLGNTIIAKSYLHVLIYQLKTFASQWKTSSMAVKVSVNFQGDGKNSVLNLQSCQSYTSESY